MSGLSEQEHDSLTECECGHFANEHSGDGCLANDYTEDWRPIRDDDKCSCTHSPGAINRHAVEAIVAAREAAARAEVLAEVEALVNDPELVKAVERRIRNYGPLDAEPYQYSRFGSIGEAALDPLRAILARHAEGSEG